MSAISKGDHYEKLPKIGSTRESANHDCIVPFIENKIDKNPKEDKLRKYDRCIPDDLMISLKQAEQPKEYLGPPSKKTLAGIKPAVPSIIRRPDNAWNHEKQREKLKFLTDQPICSCGAGKDMTFLYDSVSNESNNKSMNKSQVSKYDLSAVRSNLNDATTTESVTTTTTTNGGVPDSLIPDEFRVLVNHGVVPLKIDKSEFSTVPDDHANHLTAFPSLKPTSRYEVIQLKHTMEALLKRVGADIIEQKGPTQLHNLLDIIKQEQDIYNIVFHEVIRQVTVECKERGEILARLRERYANLLSRVPREIKSLYEEIIAQRALDRRLAEELTQFKTMVAILTDELAKVKEHDKRIGDQAEIYKNDLRKAIVDAEKNASLLTEYHSLYELQRKRLEKTIELLIEERDLWIKTSYGIGVKVCEENRLNTCKRLNLAEKSWFKLAKHFALMLTDRDTKDLIAIQKMTEEWKLTIEEIRKEIEDKEKVFLKGLDDCKNDLNKLRDLFYEMAPLNSDGIFENLPDVAQISSLVIILKRISENSMTQFEAFNGDVVLMCEEKLNKCDRIIYSMVLTCNVVRHRHDLPKEKIDDCMKYEVIQKQTKKLNEQYKVRTSGENGISRHMSTLINGVDVWVQKLLSAQYITKASTVGKNESRLGGGGNRNKLGEQEWSAFMQSIDDWLANVSKILECVGGPLKEYIESSHSDEATPAPTDEATNRTSTSKPAPEIIDHDNLCNEMNSWLASFSHFIDSQDAFLVEQVHVFHTKMVHWMVQVLIRLAKDREELSEEAKRLIYETTASVENLEKISLHLADTLEKFTESLADHSNSIITYEENNRKPNEPSNYEKEFNNIKNLQSDQQEWKYIAKILVAELKGDKSYRKSLIGERMVSSLVGTTREKEIEQEVEQELAKNEEQDEVLMEELKSAQNTPAPPPEEPEPEKVDVEQTEPTEAPTEAPTTEEQTEVAAEIPTEQNEANNEENRAEEQPTNGGGEEEQADDQDQEQEPAPPEDPTIFETLNQETNTERIFLENINFDESNHYSEAELKTTVFNSLRTIEKLQTDLIKTEERAQQAEERVGELEIKLKDALEKIRELESSIMPTK